MAREADLEESGRMMTLLPSTAEFIAFDEHAGRPYPQDTPAGQTLKPV